MKRRLTAENTNMKKGTKGYYTVEAAIFLPIFILSLLTIGYLIKVVACAEEVMHAATDESRYLASRAYTDRTATGFEGRLEARTLQDNKDVAEIDVRAFRYLYSADGMSGLIAFDTITKVNIALPVKFYDGFTLHDRLRCRGFIGSTGGTSMSFADMEEGRDSRTVWVFPTSGVRYHKESCTFVTGNPVQTLMNEYIRENYNRCDHCRPGDVPNGVLIYYFPAYGESYHVGGCNSIDKYVVTMEKSEAEDRGYTPCLKCGGV